MNDPHYRGLERIYRAAATNKPYQDLTIDIRDGESTVSIEVTSELHHIAGAMHGAHYFKLLDDAAFFAANSRVPDVFVLTAQFSIQFLRPVVSGRIRAEGVLVKPGKNTFFAESTLYAENGKLLAKGHGTFNKSMLKLGDLPDYLA